MPFDRPSLQTLVQRTLADMNSRFEGNYNALRRRVTAGFARMMAGLAHGLYGYQEWVSRQILPDTQDEEILVRYGTIRGVQRKTEASAAGDIIVTGVTGTVVPSGTTWQQADGTEYFSIAGATISGGSAIVSVTAAEPGAAFNAAADIELTIVSPISGLDPVALVAAGGIIGGLDLETIGTYRQRVIERTATFITGANAAIYVLWAKEVADVTRAWCYENTPASGQVTVLFVCDDLVDIIPDGAKVSEVADYIEEHTDPVTGLLVGRAVNCTMNVAAPSSQNINFTITPAPNTSAVQAAIQAALEDLLRRESEPGGTILLTHIQEAISTAAGEDDHTLTVPAANIELPVNTIGIMGVITWA